VTAIIDLDQRREKKLNWVIVRPVILTSGPKTKAHRALVDPRDWACGFISRADVRILVNRIGHVLMSRKRYLDQKSNEV
jgi:hypothetical protein